MKRKAGPASNPSSGAQSTVGAGDQPAPGSPSEPRPSQRVRIEPGPQEWDAELAGPTTIARASTSRRASASTSGSRGHSRRASGASGRGRSFVPSPLAMSDALSSPQEVASPLPRPPTASSNASPPPPPAAMSPPYGQALGLIQAPASQHARQSTFSFSAGPAQVTAGTSARASRASVSAATSAVTSPVHDEESGDEASSRKKKAAILPRTSRACLRCRHLKMRCNGADDPPCARCRKSNLPCEFERRSDYILNPEDRAWQQRVEQQLGEVSASLEAIADCLQESGLPAGPLAKLRQRLDNIATSVTGTPQAETGEAHGTPQSEPVSQQELPPVSAAPPAPAFVPSETFPQPPATSEAYPQPPVTTEAYPQPAPGPHPMALPFAPEMSPTASSVSQDAPPAPLHRTRTLALGERDYSASAPEFHHRTPVLHRLQPCATAPAAFPPGFGFDVSAFGWPPAEVPRVVGVPEFPPQVMNWA